MPGFKFAITEMADNLSEIRVIPAILKPLASYSV